MAGMEVPLIGCYLVECATLEDDVLFCPVMSSGCVPVPDSCSSRCYCVNPAFLYVMSCDALVWHVSLCSSSIMFKLAFYYVSDINFVHQIVQPPPYWSALCLWH